MPQHINKRAVKGAPVSASHINELIDAINSLRPIDSPTIKHSWTTAGVISHAKTPITGGGSTTPHIAFYCDIKSPEDADANKAYVRYVAGDVYANPWGRYRRPETENDDIKPYGFAEIPRDTDKAYWYVVVKYDYGEGDLEGEWSEVQAVSTDTLTEEEWVEWDEDEGWLRKVIIIAEVEMTEPNEDNKRHIKKLTQRWALGDIWFNDVMMCKA